jgi:hypothetical protein
MAKGRREGQSSVMQPSWEYSCWYHMENDSYLCFLGTLALWNRRELLTIPKVFKP